MKNDDINFRFSLKDISSKIALFEGNNNIRKKSKDEKNSNLQKKFGQENKKLNTDKKANNKNLKPNDMTKEKNEISIKRVNNKNFDKIGLGNDKIKNNFQNDKKNQSQKNIDNVSGNNLNILFDKKIISILFSNY